MFGACLTYSLNSSKLQWWRKWLFYENGVPCRICIYITFLWFWNFRETFTNEEMAVYCAICTIVALLPSCIHLIRNPQKDKFLLCLINSSLAFFLFSFQVNILNFVFGFGLDCVIITNRMIFFGFISRCTKNPFYLWPYLLYYIFHVIHWPAYGCYK